MIVGIPKGLLYHNYYPFLESFFMELGAEVITSPDTNKKILDEGIQYAVDEACLPIKVFHGHVSYLKDRSDIMVIPRIMQLRKREYICPKFCGLPEMILNSIPNISMAITEPIYADTKKRLYQWAKVAGAKITTDKSKIKEAFNKAVEAQLNYQQGIKDENYGLRIALVGHPYNIYDSFINMNVVKKLRALGVGIITEECTDDESIDKEVGSLYKRPFWTFARNSYGFAVSSNREKIIDGIIYISSFACGIDSVVTELIKDKIGDFPFMILKIDEHTGEAGLDTRIEAFVHMLERRKINEDNGTPFRKRIYRSKDIV